MHLLQEWDEWSVMAGAGFQGDPNDTRFQFEVIKGLADSIRQLTGQMADMQKTQVHMLERMATLEANRVGELVAEVRASVSSIVVRVNALESEEDKRKGAKGAFSMIKEWSPFLGMLLIAAVAFIVYGRMAGIVPAAPVAAARVEATIQHDERRIEGVVGGKL